MNEFGSLLAALTSALSDGVLLGIPMMFVLSKVKSKHGLGAAAGLAAVSYLVVIVPLQMFVVSRVPHLEFNPLSLVFGLAVCVPLMLGMTIVLEQFKELRTKRAESRQKGASQDTVGVSVEQPTAATGPTSQEAAPHHWSASRPTDGAAGHP